MPFLRKETQACNTNILKICYRFLKKIANPLFHVITFDDVSQIYGIRHQTNDVIFFLLKEFRVAEKSVCEIGYYKAFLKHCSRPQRNIENIARTRLTEPRRPDRSRSNTL